MGGRRRAGRGSRPVPQDKALALLLGHELPAAQTARDFLGQFHAADLPLLQDGKSSVPGESGPLLGLAKANAELVLDLQCRRAVKSATLDIDATVIACDKRAAKRAYDGNRGYQPVLALWAEQDVILADEFRDGNSLPSGLTRWVPAGSGNLQPSIVAAGRLRTSHSLGFRRCGGS